MLSCLVPNLDCDVQYENRLESEDVIIRFGSERVPTRCLSLR